MYGDYSPAPGLTSRVLVLEDGDKDADQVIEEARQEDAVTKDGDGNEIFWIIFENEPRRVWDFTERSLRRHLAKQPAA